MLNLRCRQCGWMQDLPIGALPRHGARVRCPECGTLLPALSSQTASPDGESLATTTSDSAVAGEVRDLLEAWLEEISPRAELLLREEDLLREHSADYARIVDLWQASHPGPEAIVLLRKTLRDLLVERSRG
jgi:hypothetical protein